MSIERALTQIDALLSVLDEADKHAQSAAKAEVAYIKSAEDVSEGQHIRVTKDADLLKSAWEAAEMGPNDELPGLCGNVGLIVEVEEDDDTVQVQWANFDTCWLPVVACSDAAKAELTIPRLDNSWLASKPDEGKEDEAKYPEDSELPADDTLFSTAEEVVIGSTVRVTRSVEVLKAKWAEAELGPHDNLGCFLGCIGTVAEAEEDDDTLQLEWQNLDTCWMPAGACYDAKGAKPSIPTETTSWLAE